MSTLPGGPADKAGLNHEALWGVVGMMKVLSGEVDAIRIEEQGTDGAEFYLEQNGNRQHWQAKRHVLSQKTWSLQLLKSAGVLDFFRQRVDAGESCVFASITDAPELRALAENAEQAPDWQEFEEKLFAQKIGNTTSKNFASISVTIQVQKYSLSCGRSELKEQGRRRLKLYCFRYLRHCSLGSRKPLSCFSEICILEAFIKS
jgi:hypothetical protein